MIERAEVKPKFEELDLAGQVDYIMEKRLPSPEKVIKKPTIEFLDPEGELTREERGKVIAMGDRTAMAYRFLKDRVISDRENPDKTSEFYLMYALAARDSREIAHTSILEQVNVGPAEVGGDPPITMEGISILAGLRDVCSLRHFAFEAFSSRGAVFPEGYWRIPKELYEVGVGEELASINREIHSIYTHLTRAGLEHYLQVTLKKEGEKDWQYKWRVLSYALDDSRQVTNGSFLNHLAMHSNSSLSLREGIRYLSASELPETREIGARLRELVAPGLPTLMRYTEASEYTSALAEKRGRVARRLGLERGWRQTGEVGKSKFLGYSITPEAEKVFLAAFLAKGGNVSFAEAFEKLRNMSGEKIEWAMREIFAGIGLHDKPPEELEMIQITAQFKMSVGAIYEAIRHRLATHIVSRFTPDHGYTMPAVYSELGLEDDYRKAMELNMRQYNLVSEQGPDYERVFGPYFVARANLVPVTIRISGYDVFHFLKIRGDEGAHPDLREPVLEFENALKDNYPIFRHLVKKS